MRLGRLVGTLTFLIGALGTVVGLKLAFRPLFYLFVAITFGAVISLATDILDQREYNITKKVNYPLHSLLDIVVFALISSGFLIVIQSTGGAPDIVYWIVALSAGVIVLRILVDPSLLAMVQVILLSFLVRTSTWFSAPVIGRDSRLHQAIIANIVNTNDLIPASVTYYHYYPVSHIIGAEVASISDVDAKIASFIAITGSSIAGIVIMYLLVDRIISDSASPSKSSLLAAMFVATAPSHVQRGALPIAQTFGLGLVPVVLYAAYRSDDIRFRLLAVFSVIPLVITHNLTPALLFTLLLVVTLGTVCIRKVGVESGNVTNFGFVLVAIGLLTTLYYYIIIDYFGMQIFRLHRVFLGGQSISTDITSSRFASSAEFTLKDPLLHLGSGLYIVAAAFVVLVIGAANSIRDGAISSRRYTWYMGVGSVFGVGGAAIALGGSELTFRALPFIMLVATLVVGAAFSQLDNGLVGRVAIVVMLLISPLLGVIAAENGIRNPGVTPTNRVQDVTVDMRSDELVAARFAINRIPKTRVDMYVYTSLIIMSLGQEHFNPLSTGNDLRSRLESIGGITGLSAGSLVDCSSATLYRERYRNFPGLEPPTRNSAIYNSGGARLYLC